MYHRLTVFIAIVGLWQQVVAQYKCSGQVFGRPKLEDCASAYLAMPNDRSRGGEFNLKTLRYFVEPQLLNPPFSPVENELVQSMEQLPKMWRYSESTFVGHRAYGW